MGHLFHRTRKKKDGTTHTYKTWTYKFYHRGKQKYFDTGETNKRKALDKAHKHEVDVKGGGDPKKLDRITFNQLKELIIMDYEINKKKSIDRMKRSVNHLQSYFDGFKAVDITTKEVQKYIQKRLKDKKANATINRELAALKRMFSLGQHHDPPMVRQIPHMPMLEENNVRQGFFTKGEYQALQKHLPVFLRPVVTLAYLTGMRKEEILSLTWKQVDLKNKMLRVYDTKTKEPRNVPLLDPLPNQLAWLREKARREGSYLPYVFLNRDGTDRIKDFRKTWSTACKNANVDGSKLFHDFRRTAVRNLIRSDVPEKIAMAISGHKTRSVFDRYNIVDDKDLTKAMQKVGRYLSEVKEPHKVVRLKKRKKVITLKE
jgi:integrase